MLAVDKVISLIFIQHAQHEQGKVISIGVHIKSVSAVALSMYFRITFLLTRLLEALYEDFPV